MKKTKTLNSDQLSEILSLIENQIFDMNFYAKYGYHFDRLIHELIPPLMEYPKDFIKLTSAIARAWNDPERIHFLYEATTCDILYALYARTKILTVHSQTLKGNAEIPDSTLIEQFKFLFNDYYHSKVQTSLAEVRDAYSG